MYVIFCYIDDSYKCLFYLYILCYVEVPVNVYFIYLSCYVEVAEMFIFYICILLCIRELIPGDAGIKFFLYVKRAIK